MKLINILLLLAMTTTSAMVAATGSMRIEVEVYNGPLSKSLKTQKAELMGTLNVADEVMKIMVRELHLSQCRLGCFGRRVITEDENNSVENGNTYTAQQYCTAKNGLGDIVAQLRDVLAKIEDTSEQTSELDSSRNAFLEQMTILDTKIVKLKEELARLDKFLATLQTIDSTLNETSLKLRQDISAIDNNEVLNDTTKLQLKTTLSNSLQQLELLKDKVRLSLVHEKFVSQTEQEKVQAFREQSDLIKQKLSEITATLDGQEAPDFAPVKIAVNSLAGELQKLAVTSGELQNFLSEAKPDLKDHIRELEASRSKIESHNKKQYENLKKKLQKIETGVNNLAAIVNPLLGKDVAKADIKQILRELINRFESQQLSVNTQKLPISTIFHSEVMDQYAQYFPVREYKEWLFTGDDIAKIPNQIEDDVIQVCPVLSDVKWNILSTLNYLAAPLDNTRLAQHYPIPDTKPYRDNDLLHCQDKILLVQNNGQNQVEFIDPAGANECLTKIAKVGKILTEGAEHWATAQISLLLESRRARIVVARAAMSAAELGNELLARADAIIKIHEGKRGADLLPTSVYLRDSEATDYLNLVDWLEAYPRKEKKWSPGDRTRMIERLITDNNWSKINTAFAQGTGETSMVFVKDNIGNWNLKSYDNDPSDTLKAYTDLGSSLFDTAVTMATGVKKPEEFLKAAASIKDAGALGQEFLIGSGSGVAQNPVTTIERELQQRLISTANQLKALDNNIKTKITTREKEVDELLKQRDEAKETALQEKYESLQSKLTRRKVEMDNQKAKRDDALRDLLAAAPDKPEQLVENLQTAEAEFVSKQAVYQGVQNELLTFEKTNTAELQLQKELAQSIAAKQKEISALQAQRLEESRKTMAVIKEIIARHKFSLETMQKNAVEQSK